MMNNQSENTQKYTQRQTRCKKEVVQNPAGRGDGATQGESAGMPLVKEIELAETGHDSGENR